MHLKKLISAALGTAILTVAAIAPTANAWSIYDTDYGMENVQIEYVGPDIGAHTGVGVLAVFALANSR